MDNDLLGRFENRRFYLTQIHLFKVFDVSNLGRNCNAFTIAESFLAEVSNSLLCIRGKSTEQEIATYERPCATFAMREMNDHHVFCILYIPICYCKITI